MLMPLDPATLPRKVVALRGLLLQREAEHTAALQQQAAELEQHTAELQRQAAELQAARNGLQEQVLRNEQLKLRLAKLLRERFGASSEKLRTAIEQLELLLGDLEEQIAETAPTEPEPPAASAPADHDTAQAGPPASAGQPAARCGGACGPVCLPEVRRNLACARRGRDRSTGLRARLIPRHPACAAEAVVPQLREHRTGAGSQPADRARPRRARSAVACAGGEVLRPSAAVSPGRDLCAQRPRPGSLDSGWLGRSDGAAGAATGRGGRCARDGGGAGARG